MRQHEREYFVSRIRSGIYYINYNNITVKVLTPTLEDEYNANEVFKQTYEKALDEDIMTEDEILDWMISKGLWTEDEEEKIKGLQKDLERLKIEIFNARNKETLREKIRIYIRAGEKQLRELNDKKQENQGNTCEGIAILEKSLSLLKACSFIGSEPFDSQALDVDILWKAYYSMFLTEKQNRELARTEPWRSLWLLRDSGTINLFANKDRELSIDQKNILVWSRMYDNIQESMDCPSDDVIADDDMLDGWFVVQRKKQEKQRAEAELESGLTNSKIANADEVFMVADTQKDADRINDMNDIGGKIVKQQRAVAIDRQGGTAVDLDFQDQQIRVRRESNEQFKGKFRS